MPYEPSDAEEATRRVVAEKPDLVVVYDSAYATAAHRLTKTIPIVTVGVSRWKSWPQIMQFAIDRRLPAITELPQGASDKRPRPLLAYGPNLESLTRMRYSYIDRILKGAKAGDLPIELPSRFDFVISLKTANSMGFKLPQSLLLRADQVIE